MAALSRRFAAESGFARRGWRGRRVILVATFPRPRNCRSTCRSASIRSAGFSGLIRYRPTPAASAACRPPAVVSVVRATKTGCFPAIGAASRRASSHPPPGIRGSSTTTSGGSAAAAFPWEAPVTVLRPQPSDRRGDARDRMEILHGGTAVASAQRLTHFGPSRGRRITKRPTPYPQTRRRRPGLRPPRFLPKPLCPLPPRRRTRRTRRQEHE